MAGFAPNIPKNAEKLLFAEDLVGYIMLAYDRSYQYSSIAEPYRRHVHNAFTDIVRYAVVFLCKKFCRSNFLKFEVLKESRIVDDVPEYFDVIADDLYSRCFSKGFDARKFLFFCAQVSSMAGVFYVHGSREAPKMAVRQIESSIEGLPMQAGAWDTVDEVARDISKLDYPRDCRFDVEDILQQEFKKSDSPRCSSPESIPSSDDERDFLDYEEGEAPQPREVQYQLVPPIVVDLREFAGIDEAWRDQMIKKLTEDIVSSSDDSSSDSSEDANES